MDKRTTEQDSLYKDLEKMSTQEILSGINQEDAKVALAIREVLPKVEQLVECASERLLTGGRLFYIGAGTSGRLGILDASECPPTYGVSPDLVVGIIAGGDKAIRTSVEFAEDDTLQAWKDLKSYNISNKDFVIGISASGTTPYVLGGLECCNQNGVATGGITSNVNSPLGAVAKYPIEVVTGPEFVTGSTRMKSGTAQKLLLNMISTACMIKLGKIKGNKMIELRPLNEKLKHRGAQIIAENLNISIEEAQNLYAEFPNVREAIEHYQSRK